MFKKTFIGLVVLVSLSLACNLLSTPAATPSPEAKAATLTPPPATAGAPSPSPAPPTSTSPPQPSASPSPVPPTATLAVVPSATASPVPTVAGRPVTVTLIHMLDVSTGWAVGHYSPDTTDHILRTPDGGNTWKDVTPPEPALAAKAATPFFLDAQNAWAIFAEQPPAASPTSVHVWRTTNGGQSWTSSQPIDVSGSEFFAPSDLVFVTAQTGWLLGHVGAGMSHDYVMAFATGDGGANWAKVVDPQQSSLAMSCQKTGLAFANANTGWVTGDCQGVVPGAPYFQKTTDGGHNWQAQALPPPADTPNAFSVDANACGTYALAFTTPTSGVLQVKCVNYSVNPATAQSWLYITGDGGQTWTTHPLPLPYGTLQFLNGSAGWWLGTASADGTGGSTLYQTQEGGQNWSVVSNKLNWTGELDFVNSQTGWVVARAGNDIALVESANGGQKWVLLKPQVVP